jgi:SAM-dependent methyltransferase
MGIMGRILGQCRKPTGWLGRLVARGMNISHSKLTDWGLSHVSVGKHFTILDIGCGGGGTVRKLAGIATEGKVYAIDYSEESVRISRKRNRELIEAGHVEVQHGSVSTLPFLDSMFDLVSAVETHYFWPDLVNDMKEVLRVLKPGGILIVMGGEYRGGKYDERNAKWVELGDMAYHSTDELRELLSAVGYSEVEVFEDYDRGWICAVGRKPTQFLDEQG